MRKLRELQIYCRAVASSLVCTLPSASRCAAAEISGLSPSGQTRSPLAIFSLRTRTGHGAPMEPLPRVTGAPSVQVRVSAPGGCQWPGGFTFTVTGTAYWKLCCPLSHDSESNSGPLAPGAIAATRIRGVRAQSGSPLIRVLSVSGPGSKNLNNPEMGP